tara:strand:- start:240 stop:641 length:402 start_codon:yes stop_codon:yes gene_type:complete
MNPAPPTPATTVTTTIDTPYERCVAFLANAREHHRWATSFIASQRELDGRLWVSTPLGELLYRVEGDQERGLLQILAGDLPPFEVRVVPNGRGCDVQFLLRRRPDQEDDTFAQDRANLRDELDLLRRLLEGDR